MNEKLERRDSKHTLGWVDGETILLQNLKKLLQMKHMFLQGTAGNEVVVKIRKHKWQVSEKFVHEALKRLGSVGEAKRHNRYSKSPNGVTMAVFATSSAASI